MVSSALKYEVYGPDNLLRFYTRKSTVPIKPEITTLRALRLILISLDI